MSPQLTFRFKRREGHRAGRPAKQGSGISHLVRQPVAARFPIHVVLKLRDGMPGLRNSAPYQVLLEAFAGGRDRFGFRLNHYSVQANHVHMIVEAEDRLALSRGIKGLSVRIAKGLNKLWGSRGKVFADRYFDHVLKTPLEVKNALRYVLLNARRHGALRGKEPDRYSSATCFDGWRESVDAWAHLAIPSSLVRAQTWLQRVGWRMHGRISLS